MKYFLEIEQEILNLSTYYPHSFCRALRADITAARQDEADLRVELADTKHELSRVLKALSSKDLGAAAALTSSGVSKSRKPLTAIGKRVRAIFMPQTVIQSTLSSNL